MSPGATPLPMPYPGLRPFEAADQPLFFGREAQVSAMLRQLEDHRFVAVVGSSGSGKSSLVRAGLLPAVREGFLLGTTDWCALLIKPGHQPYQRLTRALRGAPGGPDESLPPPPDDAPLTPGETETLAMLRRTDRGLLTALDALGISSGSRIMVVVDQFEELFAFRRAGANRDSVASRDEAAAFVGMLLRSASDSAARVWTVLTMRSDFIGDCEAFLGLPEQISRSQFLVPRLDRGQMEEAITRPAAVEDGAFKTFTFEEGLVNRISNDAGDRPDQLPLMQHALMRTWKRAVARAGGNGSVKMIHEDYDKAGGIESALSLHADAAWNEIKDDPKKARIAPRLFLLLCDISPDGQITRRRPKVDEVQAVTGAGVAQIEQVVRVFQQDDRNFLLPPPSQHFAAESYLDISHEALLRQWRLFAGEWQEQERHDASELRRLAELASLRKQSQDVGLLPAQDLERISRWKQRVSPEWAHRYVTKGAWDEALGFVEESQSEVKREQAQRQRQARQQRALVKAVAIVLMLATGFSVWQMIRAQKATGKAEYALTQQRELLKRSSLFEQASAEQYFRDGEWHKGVAYLGRALQLYPQNRQAAELLWETVVRDAPAQVHEPLGPALTHEHFVMGANFSPDGLRVMTASWDQTARIWDAQSGKPPGQPLRHDGRILSASFSSDGTRVVTASADNKARVWDAQSGKPLQTFTHASEVNSAFFSPDGSRVATAGDDKAARIWSVDLGTQIGATLTHGEVHGGSVNTATFSPDGRRVVTAADDYTARIWHADTGVPLSEPLLHENKVEFATFSPDGTSVLTASADKSVRIWDAETGLKRREFPHKESVNAASFSPDGLRIVTACGDNFARLWEVSTGRQLTEPLKHTGAVYAARFSADGSRVVTASADRTARIWDAESGKLLGEPLRHNSEVRDARFSPDGSCVVTASKDKTARVWNARTGAPPGELLRHKDRVATASFSPDGTRVVTASWDKFARIWDAKSGEPVGEVLPHDERVVSAKFSRDGTRVITASWDRTARIWDAQTGLLLVGPLNHEAQLHSAEFSPDDSLVVTTSAYKDAKLWDTNTGKQIGKSMMHGSWVMDGTFSPDGSKVVTASRDKTARLWKAQDGEPIRVFSGHTGSVVTAKFSPDGTRVVSASEDKTARLWDVETGEPLGQPLQHQGWVLSAKFSVDGNRVVTASDDKTARVWDARTGQPVGQPLQHEGWVLDAGFSPDGFRVVTACADKAARVWDVRSGKSVGEPLRHKGDVTSASFSPDGFHIITTSADNTARVWDWRNDKALRPGAASDTVSEMPATLPEVGWLGEFCEALSGLHFSDAGDLNPTSTDDRRSALDRLRDRTPTSDWWDKLRTWYFAPNRTVSPASPETMRAIAERERDRDTRESLRNALNADFAVPLAHLLLAKVLTNEDDEKHRRGDFRAIDPSVPQQAAFLRSFDLNMLAAEEQKKPKSEAAALWARAAMILLETPEGKVGVGPQPTTCGAEALRAARRAVALAPQLPAAQTALQRAQAQSP